MPLTRQRILKTAVRLADKEGIESLSMRKLARSLGQASKEFKKGVGDKDDEDKDDAAKAGDEQITMSKAELDALLAEREAKAREAQAAPPAAPDTPPSA